MEAIEQAITEALERELREKGQRLAQLGWSEAEVLWAAGRMDKHAEKTVRSDAAYQVLRAAYGDGQALIIEGYRGERARMALLTGTDWIRTAVLQQARGAQA